MLEEKDMSFFVVKFNNTTDKYEQCTSRMSLQNAKLLCKFLRDKDDTLEDFKVHCELDY